MKPALLAIVATILYGLHGVILEQKLARVSALVLMMIFYGISTMAATLLICAWHSSGRTVNYPSDGGVLLVALVASIILLFANFAMTSAYTNGGSVFIITMILACVPVTASVFRFIWNKGLPTSQQTVGYILGAIAVYLVITGGRAKPV